VKDVRGRGLMIGLEVEGFTGSELRKKLLFDHHRFTGGAGQFTVRLLPALSLSKEEADLFLKEFKKAIA
ncbi:MAG: aspartate aminotransferase family protein, partial [Muribaculaceae bacterium]|nr:aspartate aminotransferase family protein [Muribaculaceae bacterium]